MAHHDFSDFRAGDFFIFGIKDVAFYGIDHGFQLIAGNGTFVTGAADTVDQFIAVVLLTVQILLDYC